MGDEEPEEGMETEEDETPVLVFSAAGPKRHSRWIYPSVGAALVKNIFMDFAQFFAAIETVLDRRTLWEEERQEFSDSVKSNFLTIDVLDAIEAAKGDPDASASGSSGS